MSSKILTGPAGAAAARWPWPIMAGIAAASGGRGADAAPGMEPEGDAAGRLAELAQQAERRVQEARQAGFREGQAAGRTQALAQLQAELPPVMEKLAQSLAEIADLRPRLLREAGTDLVELSLGIARRILHREISIDPGALDGLARAALEKLGSQAICRVRTHPELESCLRQALAKAGRAALPLLADETLARGAVLLETGRGKLDASLETQLAEIGRGLADRIGGP
ncbi:MAG: FliH/SctL family protein [Bryobacteraceae bacterium]|jgi:flagellar assembly protein FliH